MVYLSLVCKCGLLNCGFFIYIYLHLTEFTIQPAHLNIELPNGPKKYLRKFQRDGHYPPSFMLHDARRLAMINENLF